MDSYRKRKNRKDKYPQNGKGNQDHGERRKIYRGGEQGVTEGGKSPGGVTVEKKKLQNRRKRLREAPKRRGREGRERGDKRQRLRVHQKEDVGGLLGGLLSWA